MPPINPNELSAQYRGADINTIWQHSQNLCVIDHPEYGRISPNEYRARHVGKPCPFCGQRMVQGSEAQTTRRQEAIARGYQYQNEEGQLVINRAGNHQNGYTYFHPHYVTIDHRINKARCPERMLDAENLQAMCWKCNNDKGDNNAFELQHTLNYIKDLAQDTLDEYPLL